MQNKYRAELASSQSCFSIRRSLSRERILDWSIGKGPKIYLTELRDECHIWKEEGSTFPHHHACFQENYVQIKSLSHHGHEDGDSSACRPPSIKCGRTIWLTHRARAVWSAPPVAIRMADAPTGREPPTAHEQWVLLHGRQGGTSLEYQTYTSAHPFDTMYSSWIDPPPPLLNIFEAHSDKTSKVLEQRNPIGSKFFAPCPQHYIFSLRKCEWNISLHLFPHSFFATCCLSKLVDREFVICSHPSFKVLQRTAQVLKRRIKFYILIQICFTNAGFARFLRQNWFSTNLLFSLFLFLQGKLDWGSMIRIGTITIFFPHCCTCLNFESNFEPKFFKI